MERKLPKLLNGKKTFKVKKIQFTDSSDLDTKSMVHTNDYTPAITKCMVEFGIATENSDCQKKS